MEEFQEAEVVWAEQWTRDAERPIRSRPSPMRNSRRRRVSIPVDIPNRRSSTAEGSFLRDCDEEETGEMVPPHELIARRISSMTTFSVCTGYGRTLKGRDLSRMRNSVLRMTGFLEG